MIGKFWEKEKKKEGKIPTRKVRKNYNYNGKVYSSLNLKKRTIQGKMERWRENAWICPLEDIWVCPMTWNVIGNLRYPLTARKRHICASWDLPRKSKNLRPCAVHFGVLHKVFFSSYFVLANHSATPAFLPFGTWADPEKISIFLWANSNSPPLYYRFTPSKRAGNPRIFLFEILTGKG